MDLAVLTNNQKKEPRKSKHLNKKVEEYLYLNKGCFQEPFESTSGIEVLLCNNWTWFVREGRQKGK